MFKNANPVAIQCPFWFSADWKVLYEVVSKKTGKRKRQKMLGQVAALNFTTKGVLDGKSNLVQLAIKTTTMGPSEPAMLFSVSLLKQERCFGAEQRATLFDREQTPAALARKSSFIVFTI